MNREMRLKRTLALIEAERTTIQTCHNEFQARAYIWYCKRKTLTLLVKTIGLIILSLISPTIAWEFVKNSIIGG